jgi:hypothetical protein
MLQSQAIVRVAAVELPVPVIRELSAVHEINGDISLMLTKHPRHRDKIVLLRDFLSTSKARNAPFLFVYSMPDDDYVFLVFKKQ